MTREDAQLQAARLGMSAWTVEVVMVGKRSELAERMCIGFAGIELPVAEADSWEEALEMAARIVFTP